MTQTGWARASIVVQLDRRSSRIESHPSPLQSLIPEERELVPKAFWEKKTARVGIHKFRRNDEIELEAMLFF